MHEVQKTLVPPFVLLLLMHEDLPKWSKRCYEENIKRHYSADWYSRLLKEAQINVMCAATSPLIIADWRFVFHYVIRDDQYRSITLLPPLIPSFHRLYNVSIHYLMAWPNGWNIPYRWYEHPKLAFALIAMGWAHDTIGWVHLFLRPL